MRARCARILRKWADLIDPRTPPSCEQELSVKVNCDASQFEAALQRMNADLEGFIRRAEKAAALALPATDDEVRRSLVYFIDIAQKTEGAAVWRALFSEALRNHLSRSGK